MIKTLLRHTVVVVADTLYSTEHGIHMVNGQPLMFDNAELVNIFSFELARYLT